AAGSDRRVSESTYHQSFWAEASPRRGQSLFPAQAINHTDEEMEMLAALVRQRTAWQITGMKGPKDGRGYQYEKRPEPTDGAYPGHSSPN
ncbi:MAG: iron dicitrate transport regulator FecR, partial [Burkholderiaceae bacterium]|nr:iron dicitrate transport regulator FecR [Burkholderiaceae bacterium]